jgi:pimeloyl-ACP methyl ester carboxylesterase
MEKDRTAVVATTQESQRRTDTRGGNSMNALRGKREQRCAGRAVVAAVVPALMSLAPLAGMVDARSADGASATTEPAMQLLHLPGIGGECAIDHTLLEGLSDGGLRANVRIYDWTGPDRGLLALADVRRHREQAQKVAELLIEMRRAHPNDRIVLTGHSGGAGLAAWALESLPADVRIDEWLMLAPALSPGYDLSKALRHVTGRAFAFCSERDIYVLGTGTRMFGTIDRVNVEAAGKVGFERPPGADRAMYAKLTNIFYIDDWARLGNDGDHLGALGRSFSRKFLAPTLIGGRLPDFVHGDAPQPMPPTTRPGHNGSVNGNHPATDPATRPADRAAAS